MHDRVTITIVDQVADVRLNRADKLNALDPAMFDGLEAAIARVAAASQVRVVVLSGEGRAFCAGLDMASMASGGASAGSDLQARTHGDANGFQHVAWGWRTLPVPVIAALTGIVFGGGLQVAMGADIRIATPDARLSVMEMKWGLVPDMGGIALWRGLVRDDVLRELVYSHRELNGTEAQALGLVTRIAADPRAEAFALAREIAGKNPEAVRAAKRLLNAMPDERGSALLEAESREQAAVIRRPNQLEAVAAGLARRAPVFSS